MIYEGNDKCDITISVWSILNLGLNNKLNKLYTRDNFQKRRRRVKVKPIHSMNDW